MTPRSSNPAVRLAVAVLVLGAALGWRLLFATYLQDQLPVAGFIAAVALTSYLAGTWPAALAALLGAGLMERLFITPLAGDAVAVRAARFVLLGYFIACTGIIFLGSTTARARARALESSEEAKRRARELEAEVARRQEVEQNLREHEQVLRAVIDGTPDSLVFLKDLEGRYITANQRFEALVGMTREQLRGKTDFELFARPRAEAFRANDLRVLETGKAITFEEGADLASGPGVFSSSKYPLRDSVGRSYGVGCIAHDVTERTRAEAELAAAQERLELAHHAGRISSFDRNLVDGRTVLVSGVEVTYGRTGAVQDYEEWRRWVHPDDIARVEALQAESFAGRAPYEAEFRVVWPDGSVHWIEARGEVRRDEAGRPIRFVGCNVDVTARKQAQEALQRSEEKYRSLFELNLDGIFLSLPNGTILDANPAACQMLGASKEEIAGRTRAEIFEETSVTRDLFERRGRTGKATGEVTLLRNNGERLPVEINSILLGDGAEQRAFVMFRDISERTRVEAALREADASKNQFLATLSHELRNPLAPIRNCLYILDRAQPGGDQARRALTTIDRQVGQMTRLIDDLLDVTRITRGKMLLQRERLDLCELVRHTVEDHRSLFAGNGIELKVSTPADAQWVFGDWTRLAQVIGNLLTNAAKFCGRGGATQIAVTPDGGRATIVVRDNGRGIAPEMMANLFRPFVQADDTLDRRMGGLGLGLALIKGIVEMHDGEVAVRSDGPGRGAEFVVRLPVEQQPSILLRQGDSPEERKRTPRRVLIIEDNVDAAESLREALELEGHLVAVAAAGPEGLESARCVRPEVVLCDIGLPGMSGYQVAQAFRADAELRPAHLVALSGYASAEDVARAKEAGFDRHLAKPPEIEEIMRVVEGRA